jgi:signal transduction histidine kinase
MAALLRHPLVLLGLAVTLVVAVVPSLHFSYYTPSLRIALETASAIAALTAAFVVFGRFRRGGSLNQLMLSLAFGLLAAASSLVALFVAVPAAPRELLVVAFVTRLVGAWTLAASAFLPAIRPRRKSQVVVVLATSTAGIIVVLVSVFLLFSGNDAQDLVGRLADAGQPHPERNAVIVAFQLATFAGFLAAAAGFARAAERTGDVFLRWVAVGAVLAALARVQYVYSPPAGKYWLHTGDVFILAFYCVLLFAAAYEVRGYWRGLTEAAVLDERRRIARELHDGVAQELAFIARRARRPATPDSLPIIAASAERALNDSRRAFAALTLPFDERLDLALAQAVEAVAQRTGASVDLALDENVDVSPPTREALVRIACEAVGNAARHAGVERVRLELRNGDRVLLRVSDEGVGFDPGAPPESAGGYGLGVMRERAAALGADLRIASRPGAGTTVEVELR